MAMTPDRDRLPALNSHDLIAQLARSFESEQRASISVVTALREVAELLEQRIEEPALTAALEVVAKVAAKWGGRGKAVGQLVQGFGAMAAAEAERRSAQTQMAQAAAAPPAPPAEAPPEKAAPEGAQTPETASAPDGTGEVESEATSCPQ